MRIRIKGRNHKVKRQELRYALRWMCDQLMPEEVTRDLQVTLYLKPLEEYNAWMTPANYDPVLRSFKIVLATNNARHRQLRYLGHEVVHIKQYAMKEMRDRWVPAPVSSGVKYKVGSVRFKRWIFNPDLVEYKKQPWEVEARKLQGELYRKYRDHLKEIDMVPWKS